MPKYLYNSVVDAVQCHEVHSEADVEACTCGAGEQDGSRELYYCAHAQSGCRE